MIVPIVARCAPSAAIDIIEQAFFEAGIETMLFKLVENEDRSAEVMLQLVENTQAHPIQVWIVPALFADFMRVDQDRATAARKLMGMSKKAYPPQKLIVTLEPFAGSPPDGCHVIGLQDIVDGRFSARNLKSLFA